MNTVVCPECFHGLCQHCIGAGCYCECQLVDLIDPRDEEPPWSDSDTTREMRNSIAGR